MKDLGNSDGWNVGEYCLNLNPSSSWATNQKYLQNVMNSNKPIRDASAKIQDAGGFLQKERDHLTANGWVLDSLTGYWNPPGL